MARVVGEHAGGSFIAAFGTLTGQGRRNTARMLGAARAPSTGHVTALSGTPSKCFSDGDFVLASRLRLGLGVATAIAPQPCQCGVTDAEHLDHPTYQRNWATLISPGGV